MMSSWTCADRHVKRISTPFTGNTRVMHAPHVLILRAPGANCDSELQFAFERAGALAEKVHVNQLRANPNLLHRFQILAVPGGFSYGDDVAAGKILALQLSHFL